MKKEYDLVIYWILTALLIFYSFYIKSTCEELGCLAVIFPIILIFIISGIEFVICLFLFKKHKSSVRNFTLVITGIVTLLALSSIIISRFN